MEEPVGLRQRGLDSKIERVASQIVDSAYTVHVKLGPGLLESVYEACLAYELRERGLDVRTQVVLPVRYGEIEIEAGLRLDIIVENLVIVEVKAIEGLLPVHDAQLLTYLKLTNLELGFLINFNVARIKHGIKRFVRDPLVPFFALFASSR